MKQFYFPVLFFIATSVITSCANQKAWVYSGNQYTAMEVVSKKAVVIPFEDARQNDNHNYFALYMIPLFPFGWQTFTVPEGSQMHMNSGLWTNYKPTEDYAKALASDLKNLNYFEEAYFDFKKGDSDYIFTGKILNTDYHGKIISYGLSVYGPLLWFFCLPSSYITNNLEVELNCTDAHSGKVLFTKIYKSPEYSEVSIIYALQNDFNYAAMLKDIYKEFINDLQAENILPKSN